jgi:hypothetical protein
VEGNNAQEIMFSMRTQSGSTPIVLETIIKLIECNQPRYKGITIEDGELWLLPQTVLEFFREELSISTRQTVTFRMIENVLKSIVRYTPKSNSLKQTRRDLGRKYWHCIDTGVLLQVAENNGMESKKLTALCEMQRAMAEGTFEGPPVNICGGTENANILNFAAFLEASRGEIKKA